MRLFLLSLFVLATLVFPITAQAAGSCTDTVAYLDGVMAAQDQSNAALNSLSDLTSRALNDHHVVQDPAWKAEMAAANNTLKGAAARVRSLDGSSSEVSDLHQQYLSIAEDWDYIAQTYGAAIEKGDIGGLTDALDRMLAMVDKYDGVLDALLSLSLGCM